MSKPNNLTEGHLRGPQIETYGSRGLGHTFDQQVEFLLVQGEKVDSECLYALQQMKYWQSGSIRMDNLVGSMRNNNEKAALIKYFLLANTVIFHEEMQEFMRLMIESIDAKSLFEIGNMLPSYLQVTFSMLLLSMAEKMIPQTGSIPQVLADIFEQIGSVNKQLKYTLFPMERYPFPGGVSRPDVYRTFLNRCRANKFKGSFFGKSDLAAA